MIKEFGVPGVFDINVCLISKNIIFSNNNNNENIQIIIMAIKNYSIPYNWWSVEK